MEYLAQFQALVLAYPLLFLGGAIVLGLLLWRQPGQTLKALFAIGILCVIAYLLFLVMHFAIASFNLKTHMVEKP